MVDMVHKRRAERSAGWSGLALTLAAAGVFLLGIGRVPTAFPGAPPPAAAAAEPASVTDAGPSPGEGAAATATSAAGAPVTAPAATAVAAPAATAVAAPAARSDAPLLARPAPDSPRILDIGDLRRPRVRVAAGILYNPRTEEILWERRGLDQRPIASITKVMTALVLLDRAPDLDGDVVVSRRDVRRASTTYLRRGERVTLDTLLHLALIASDNVAARILARASGWGTRRFVKEMNAKAAALGLEGTSFVEPSGLDERNVSTPYDVARLLAAASEVPAIARIMRKGTHRVRTDRRSVNIRNTNRLLRSRDAVRGGKTGYISEAGFCLTALFELPDAGPVVLVVLGAGSNAGRFTEAGRLIDWMSTTGRSLLEPELQTN